MNDKIAGAVTASLENNWEEAVILNTEILEVDPDNIPALNRLGRAYIELGQQDLAKEVYNKVISLDRYNPVASKGLKALSNMVNPCNDAVLVEESFIEDSGTTKSVQLIKLAEKKFLLSLRCKQRLHLVPHTRLIAVVTDNKQTIGYLPDDLSLKLTKFIKSGYAYSSCVKSYSENQVTIFLREIKRPNRLSASSSFSRGLAKIA